MNFENVNYKILNPGGNKTALVIGNEYSTKERKLINDKILEDNADVEQVGFLSTKEYRLEMAGGEFCVNATRCAIYEYLQGKPGAIELSVSGVNEKISGGIKDDKKVYANMQLNRYSDELIEKNEPFTLIKLDGILHAVLDEEASKSYIEILKNDVERAKSELKGIMQTFDTSESAIGINLLEIVDSKTKINPIVWVKTVDTLYYETACGSGSLATSIYKNNIEGVENVEIVQPSGYSINVQLNKNENFIKDAVVIGSVFEEN